MQRRSIRKRDWPRGLYEPRAGYFVFRTPEGKTFPLGRVPLAHAKAEAIAANAHLSTIKPTLVARIAGGAHTVAEVLDLLPVPENPNTAKSYRTAEGKIRQAIGERLVASLTVADLAKTIADAGKHDSGQMVRARLRAMYRKALALGWVDRDLSAPTENPQGKVARGRLTLESFLAIREQAPAWAQHGFDVALLTGADVSTCASLRGDMIENGHITYKRAKVTKWIRVPLALRLDVVGLELVALVAGRGAGPIIATDDGQAVTPRRLSDAFTEARRAAGIPDEGAPTFHEIRSLAKRLHEREGRVNTLQLLGHTSERTGEIYADPRGVEPVQITIK